MGIMASLFERSHSGQGQVIDSNMVEGKVDVSQFIFDKVCLNGNIE